MTDSGIGRGETAGDVDDEAPSGTGTIHADDWTVVTEADPSVPATIRDEVEMTSVRRQWTWCEQQDGCGCDPRDEVTYPAMPYERPPHGDWETQTRDHEDAWAVTCNDQRTVCDVEWVVPNRPGTYRVTFTGTDSSNNSASASI